MNELEKILRNRKSRFKGIVNSLRELFKKLENQSKKELNSSNIVNFISRFDDLKTVFRKEKNNLTLINFSDNEYEQYKNIFSDIAEQIDICKFTISEIDTLLSELERKLLRKEVYDLKKIIKFSNEKILSMANYIESTEVKSEELENDLQDFKKTLTSNLEEIENNSKDLSEDFDEFKEQVKSERFNIITFLSFFSALITMILSNVLAFSVLEEINWYHILIIEGAIMIAILSIVFLFRYVFNDEKWPLITYTIFIILMIIGGLTGFSLNGTDNSNDNSSSINVNADSIIRFSFDND